MATSLPGAVDEKRLQAIEVAAMPLFGLELRDEDAADPRVRRYLEDLAPGTALELIGEIRELREALRGVVSVLEEAGFTREAHGMLDEAERGTPAWRAVARAWEACGAAPGCVLRYTRGPARTFPTPEAALAAAVESLEMNEAYPEAIEVEGTAVMDTAAILRAWEDRHDPG